MTTRPVDRSHPGAMHQLRPKQARWPIIRIFRMIWVGAGLLFLLWLWRSFQAQGFPFEQLYLTPSIYIAEDAKTVEVLPIDHSHDVGLIFYPGGMVDPHAYLPMAHQLAGEGYPVIIVKLPYRLALLEAQEAAVHDYVRQIMADRIMRHWLIGGHSRGGMLASHFAQRYPSDVDALALIGTTHPKAAAWSLAGASYPVTKIYATNDGIADPTTILTNRALLPPQTQFVAIEGGNHSQFGYYGQQLGDGRATISRAEQQQQLVALLTEQLERLRTQ